jgi:hypothetical protein
MTVSRDKGNGLLLVLYYTFKLIPMIVGGVSIYLGYRLFILGVTGQASLSVNSQTVSGQLLHAAPGLFFAVGGLVANIVAVWKGAQFSIENDDTSHNQYANQPGKAGLRTALSRLPR